MPGLARGLPADRQARPLQLLRGLHPHRRLDVQPAREVAEVDGGDPVAAADRVAQLPALVARLAPGPQRLHPPGSRLHRPRREQEGGDHPRLPAAGRELPALGRRPLPAQPPLRERDRRRQAAGAQLPLDRRRGPPLHPRARDLGVGLERRGQRPGRRDGLLRRRPDARDARRRRHPPAGAARPEGARGQRRRPDAPPAGRRSIRTASSDHDFDTLFTTRPADRLRLPRLPLADPPPHLPPHEPREPPRARLQGGGHDDDAVRHGDAERPRPLPPRDRRDRPGARARVDGGAPPPADGRRARPLPRVHARGTARTRRRSATGPGRTPSSAGPRRQRRARAA